MGTLDVQDVSGKWSPDFFGEKSSSRKEIESHPTVKSLIGSKMLLKKPMNLFMYDSLRLSNIIQTTISDYETTTPKPPFEKVARKIDEIIKVDKKKKTLSKEYFDKVLKKAQAQVASELRFEAKSTAIKTTNSLEDNLNEFRKANKSAKAVEILRRIGLYFCKKCNALLCTNTFESRTCQCGNVITHVKNTDKFSAMVLSDEAQAFIKNNIWLEYGVESIFLKAGYQTACGIYVMGSSGVRYEIDLLAVNKIMNRRTIAECKNRPVSMDDIFKLYSEMSDLGCSRSYVFSTGTPESEDVKKFAISKNITVFERVLELSEVEMVEQLQE